MNSTPLLTNPHRMLTDKTGKLTSNTTESGGRSPLSCSRDMGRGPSGIVRETGGPSMLCLVPEPFDSTRCACSRGTCCVADLMYGTGKAHMFLLPALGPLTLSIASIRGLGGFGGGRDA